MRSLVLVCLLSVAQLPAATAGASCVGSIWDDGKGLAVAEPPSGFDAALVREALGVDGDICGWAAKPWGRDGRLFVAVMEQPDTLFVGVFEKTDALRLRARGRMSYGDNDGLNFDRFDFAPYRINPDEIAIGIRTGSSLAYAGGGGRCEGVSLFRLREDRLDLVLYTLIDYSAMVRGEPVADDIPYSVYDVAAAGTLGVSKQQTEGFFDYVRTVKVSSPFDDRTRWQSRYAWNGERYAVVGDAEPLEPNCLSPGFDMPMGGPEVERFPDWVSEPLAGTTGAATAAASGEQAAPAAAPAEQTKWTTRMGSLKVGNGGEKATFTNLRSTCGAFGLTMSLTIAAPDVRKCLGESEVRHVAIDLDAGRLVTSRVTPDDRQGQCVLAALGGGNLQGLSCALEADVSR